jgi:pyruvate formate lyase activating enzyme
MVRADGTLVIGGFEPFTTVDFPGRLAAVVFCQGCPWRCRYCHNPHLQRVGLKRPVWTWARVLGALAERRGFLDAVVFSGGEPTMQAGLGRAMSEVGRLGYAIGLHTAGIFPHRLEKVLPFLDWVGLDIKAPFDVRYQRITGRRDSGDRASSSLELVLASGVAFELRTTVHPALLGPADVDEINAELQGRSAPSTRVQPFRPVGCRDAELVARAGG